MTTEREKMEKVVAGAERFRIEPLEDEMTAESRAVHPLARYVEIGDTPAPPRMVIPGFIQEGVVIFAGARAVGKTTSIFPLAMVAAGVHGSSADQLQLHPRHWRHVIYISEDVSQVQRILHGMVKFGGLGLDIDIVKERIHLVAACRMQAEAMVQVGKTYRKQFARHVEGVEILPLVVLDTKSAVFEIESDNDNAQASRAIAAVKQNFEALPTWIIGHVNKASLMRADIDGLTVTGAGSYENDVHQVLYLTLDSGRRYLVRGKTRFEAKWPELEITSDFRSIEAYDEFGDMQEVGLRWGTAAPPAKCRKEAQADAQERARKDSDSTLRQEVIDAVQTAWLLGNPLNRQAVKAKINRNRQAVVDCIETLLAERWLLEVPVPPKERTNPKRAAFLVVLITEEHEAVIRGEDLPPAKLVIPASWRKASTPFAPEPEGESSEPAEVDHAEQ